MVMAPWFTFDGLANVMLDRKFMISVIVCTFYTPWITHIMVCVDLAQSLNSSKKEDYKSVVGFNKGEI